MTLARCVTVSDSYANHYVAIIDGKNDSIITKIRTEGASAVSVDQLNNTIYVTAGGENLLYVIHGSTDSILRVIDTGRHYASDVLAISNPRKVLVAHSGSESVAIIDGKSHSTERNLVVGTNPVEIAVNTFTKKAYVVNHLDDTISVFNLMWR